MNKEKLQKAKNLDQKIEIKKNTNIKFEKLC